MPTASHVSRFSARGYVLTRWASRFQARGTMLARRPSRLSAYIKPGWELWARNVATGAETFLGFIDADASPKSLTDVALADGVYEIEVRPSEFLWPASRSKEVVTATISGGSVETGLPAIQDLAAEIVSTLTYISWRVAAEQSGSFDFGVWYSATTPVVITGAPDAVVTFIPGTGDYQVTRSQSGSEYVAVAAYSGPDQGEASEIALPWSTTPPTSPPDQYGYPQGVAED